MTTADHGPPGQATLHARLTPRQEQILAFIREFGECNGYAPSMREIGGGSRSDQHLRRLTPALGVAEQGLPAPYPWRPAHGGGGAARTVGCPSGGGGRGHCPRPVPESGLRSRGCDGGDR